MEKLYSQAITRLLARELTPPQRQILLALIRRLVAEAHAEGSGAGIWYILREHEEVLRDLGVDEELSRFAAEWDANATALRRKQEGQR